IGPDESLVEIDTSRMNFSNPTDFQVLSNGDLVFSDFQGEAIIQFDINETPVAWDFIVPTSPSTEALTLGLGGELYVTDRSGQILITDTDTLDTTIGRDDAGRQYRWMTAVDERPGFDDGLLVWDGASDELLLFADFDLTSDPTVVGTGFEDVRDLTFGPDGALYVALNRGEIVRVTPDVVPAPGALAALGLGLIGANRRRRLG
ncbi:MAG: PEP-CTERM sorting domain-containing protein, partial [Planctomycetota bacterium]